MTRQILPTYSAGEEIVHYRRNAPLTRTLDCSERATRKRCHETDCKDFRTHAKTPNAQLLFPLRKMQVRPDIVPAVGSIMILPALTHRKKSTPGDTCVLTSFGDVEYASAVYTLHSAFP
jgi:hypothetical protein